MKDIRTGEPYINVWFGHFYRPAYDDEEFIQWAVPFLKKLGFNSVMLDSKAWEDFQERYKKGPASQFVKMHEYIQKQLDKNGMSHEFLALYLNGDNLYPNIRFSPPVYGESVVTPKGEDGKWYRYWSEAAKSAMISHVKGLLECYGKNCVKVELEGKTKKPLCSMWDPIVAPSFDQEGRQRYVDWLKGEYEDDIRSFNMAYKTEIKTFDELMPEDYWFSCKYPGENSYSQEDIHKLTPKCRMLADNKKWQARELMLYFKDMEQRLHELDESLYLCPDLAQWGYFLNVDGSMLAEVGMADLWDTAVRGIDIYKLFPYVDCAHFISVPVTPYGDPDIYVTACQHNMMRNLNYEREFVGGIYWGRFLYQDIYSVISPCETIATIVASKASGYTSYGMCGLDDGGVLQRMPEGFNESLETGNRWAKEIIPLLGELETADAAILFPQAMALIESMRTQGNKERRMDFLGWYKTCCDYGVPVDIVGIPNLLDEGRLEKYRILIIPEDNCYVLNPCAGLETALRHWVEDGGVVLHGPRCVLAEKSFGIQEKDHIPDAFFYEEKGMLQSTRYSSYLGGEKLASYLSDGETAVSAKPFGKGRVYSFGFDYGYSYAAKIAPHVPIEQKNNELYPLEMMKTNIVAEILSKEMNAVLTLHKNIEIVRFSNGTMIINHSSFPYKITESGLIHCQYPAFGELLAPHTAAFIQQETEFKIP